MPIKQKIRPLLLLKKQQGHFQRISRNTYAIGNRSSGRGFRATRISATIGSDDIVVYFTEDVVVTDPTSGVSITVNGQPATFTAAKGTQLMTYTLTSQNPIDWNDDIIWTYDSAAAGLDPYAGAISGEVLEDTSFRLVMPEEPLFAEGGWTGNENCAA